MSYVLEMSLKMQGTERRLTVSNLIVSTRVCYLREITLSLASLILYIKFWKSDGYYLLYSEDVKIQKVQFFLFKLSIYCLCGGESVSINMHDLKNENHSFVAIKYFHIFSLLPTAYPCWI